MMSQSNEELWYFLVSGQQDLSTGCYANFYSYGQHLGEALNHTLEAALQIGISHPYTLEASFLDRFKSIQKRKELRQVSDTVHMRQHMHVYSLENEDAEFRPPTGVIKAVIQNAIDYELIKENFVAYAADENGFYYLEVVVAHDKLEQIYKTTIQALPAADALSIEIQPHWEQGITEHWQFTHHIEIPQIIRFLEQHPNDLLPNGHIKLTVNVQHAETSWTLDDHKSIQFRTKDESLFKKLIGLLKKEGYEQTHNFYSLGFDFYHWHYRPATSLPKAAFKTLLAGEGFECKEKKMQLP